MTNLLDETISAMPTDAEVAWVGSADGKLAISWDEFVALAKDIEYNSSYGSNEIPMDLVVVGKDDWWLERHEYDGSEWWELKQKPLIDAKAHGGEPFTVIRPGREWGLFPNSLAEVQKASKYEDDIEPLPEPTKIVGEGY